MTITINDDNLELKDVQEFNTKVRALLTDENNNILIANYGNVILLPGGSIDGDEGIEVALTRELKEEVGVEYSKEELTYLSTIEYYQKDYPKRNGQLQNRLIKTHYYIGTYKGINKQSLTEKEQKDNFRLELVPLDELENIVLNNNNSNPRNRYFIKELLTIITYYNKTQTQQLSSKNLLLL